MQPQNSYNNQEIPIQTPTPTQQALGKKTNKLTIVLSLFLVLTLLVGAGAAFLLTSTISDKDEQIASAQGELDTTKSELASAQARIEELDNPQKKARDVKRKTDLAKFITEINNFAANNNGRYPTTEPSFFAEEFSSVYIDEVLENFVDPDTQKPYDIIPVANVQTPPGVTLGTIQYQWPGKCSGSEFDDDATERQAAARLVLESGDIYCIDS